MVCNAEGEHARGIIKQMNYKVALPLNAYDKNTYTKSEMTESYLKCLATIYSHD